MSSFIYPDSATRKMFGVQGKNKAYRDKIKMAEAERAQNIIERLKKADEPVKKIHWFWRFFAWLRGLFK